MVTAISTASKPKSVVNLITGLSETDDVSLKGSPTVVGDTVGDPFKDTSSVSLNPVIKFTTLFGLLAVEIAVTMQSRSLKTLIGSVFFLIALIFVYRSFYA